MKLKIVFAACSMLSVFVGLAQAAPDVEIKDVYVSGSMTCSAAKTWTMGFRGRLENGSFLQAPSVGDAHRNTAKMSVDKNSLTFEWFFYPEDGYERHLKKRLKVAPDQSSFVFTANMNWNGQQSKEDCNVRVNFAESPIQQATSEKKLATEEQLAKLDEKTKTADDVLQQQIDKRKKEVEDAQKELDRINAEVAATKAQQQKLSANQQNLQSQQTETAKIATDSQNLLNGMKLPEFEPVADWVIHVPSIPIQQQQFCRMINQYRVEFDAVELTQNEIKKNELFKARQLDIANLLPKGEISNWIVRVKEIRQAKNGDAEISVSLPCLAMMGSNTCNLNPEMYQGTIRQDSLMYREIAKLSANQFVAFSAKLLFAVDPDTKKPSPEFAKVQQGVHCTDNKIILLEKFVVEPTNVVQLK